MATLLLLAGLAPTADAQASPCPPNVPHGGGVVGIIVDQGNEFKNNACTAASAIDPAYLVVIIESYLNPLLTAADAYMQATEALADAAFDATNQHIAWLIGVINAIIAYLTACTCPPMLEAIVEPLIAAIVDLANALVAALIELIAVIVDAVLHLLTPMILFLRGACASAVPLTGQDPSVCP